jgi:hypothetical protein
MGKVITRTGELHDFGNDRFGCHIKAKKDLVVVIGSVDDGEDGPCPVPHQALSLWNAPGMLSTG